MKSPHHGQQLWMIHISYKLNVKSWVQKNWNFCERAGQSSLDPIVRATSSSIIGLCMRILYMRLESAIYLSWYTVRIAYSWSLINAKLTAAEAHATPFFCWQDSNILPAAAGGAICPPVCLLPITLQDSQGDTGHLNLLLMCFSFYASLYSIVSKGRRMCIQGVPKIFLSNRFLWFPFRWVEKQKILFLDSCVETLQAPFKLIQEMFFLFKHPQSVNDIKEDRLVVL